MASLDLAKLNPAQAEAVKHKQGPLVIYSGAGSGKTRVIVYRIAKLIEEGVSPASIMAVTFTNKAAREMKERVEALIGPRSRSVLVSTFHSACARFLRMFAREIGYTDAFTIYDDDDQKSVLKDVIKELEVPEKFLSPAILKNRIDALKNKGETPETYLASISKSNASPLAYSSVFRKYGEQEHAEIIQKCYALYQKKMKSQNAMDFNDLILLMVKLLEENPRVLQQIQGRFQYFLVDEFQDTNPIQFRLMRALSSHTNNLCIVGDDDQSIYSWRGAEPTYILDFSKTYPDAKTVLLEQNYRSTKTIVKAATELISKNLKRASKSLWTEGVSGEMIRVRSCADAYEEANAICNAILNGVEAGARFSEFGILYRTNAQSRALEDALRRRMLPYVIYGSVRFYERAEVKSLMAYLRLLVNPDDDAAFARVIGTPKRGFGDKALQKLKEIANANSTSLARIAARIARNDLVAEIGRGAGALKTVTNDFDRWHVMLSTGESLGRVFSDIVAATNFEEYVRISYPEDFDDRWLNVLELRNALIDYEMRFSNGEIPARESLGETSDEVNTADASPHKILNSFLEEALLTVEPTVHNVQTGHADAITMMTIHSSKGLEFDRVFISGLEEGVLPHNNSLESDAAIEEERRLMYVAITRARQHLTISYIARNRFRSDMPAVPSRFVFELPSDTVSFEGAGTSTRSGESWVDRSKAMRSRFNDGLSYEPVDDVFSDDNYSSQNRFKKEPPKARFWQNNYEPEVEVEQSESSEWRAGQQVEHKVFGVGVIQEIEKTLDGFRLQVMFPVVGIKKLMHTFVTPL